MGPLARKRYLEAATCFHSAGTFRRSEQQKCQFSLIALYRYISFSFTISVLSAISEKSTAKRTVRLQLQLGEGNFELLSLRATELQARRIRATESPA